MRAKIRCWKRAFYKFIILYPNLDHNGNTGVPIMRYIPAQKRYAVQVEHAGDESIAVRPENLRRRDRTPRDCGKYMVFRGRNEEDTPMPSGATTL